MKKIATVLMSLVLSLSVVGVSSASVNSVSVMPNLVNKSTLNVYVKNNSNSSSAVVKLELQKDGRTISTAVVIPSANRQVKSVFNLSSSGKYKIKYTSGGKSSTTSTFNK